MNYTELKIEIDKLLRRGDMVARIPSFITLAEARFNRILATLNQEVTTTIDIASQYTDLPADYNKGLILSYSNRLLKKASPEYLTLITATGEPEYYAIIGDKIQVAPIPEQTYTFNIFYVANIPSLSDTNVTNWLLDQSPDLYIYEALTHAAMETRATGMVKNWAGMRDAAFMEIVSKDKKQRRARGAYQDYPSIGVGGSYDVWTDTF